MPIGHLPSLRANIRHNFGRESMQNLATLLKGAASGPQIFEIYENIVIHGYR
jgi:hypothetical protein